MTKQTFNIPNISCGHCVRAIKDELTEINGVSQVTGDHVNKTITVEWNQPASLQIITEKLKQINYPSKSA